MPFEELMQSRRERVEAVLDACLPDPALPPQRLHEAMRYSVLSSGKRIRPILVYATGTALEVPLEVLDIPAAAIELMHAFSLVHDDLPAMDNDDLRRGRPTTHRAFDEATAILAADALQPLAFGILASRGTAALEPEMRIAIIDLLAESCGSNGMTGGQAIDLQSEGRTIDSAELEHMYRLKTGKLLRASVMSAACCVAELETEVRNNLELFVDSLGLAFQIRDDILDIEGSTEQIGKHAGADIARGKATYPALFGVEKARERLKQLLDTGLGSLDILGAGANTLRQVAKFIVLRET